MRTDESCPADRDYRRLTAIDQSGPRLRRRGAALRASRGGPLDTLCGSPRVATRRWSRSQWHVYRSRADVPVAAVLVVAIPAAANRAHAVVVGRVAAALRVGELCRVVALPRLVCRVDARPQRLVGHAGGQRRARVAGGAELLHVVVVGHRGGAGGVVAMGLELHLRADRPRHVHGRHLREGAGTMAVRPRPRARAAARAVFRERIFMVGSWSWWVSTSGGRESAHRERTVGAHR